MMEEWHTKSMILYMYFFNRTKAKTMVYNGILQIHKTQMLTDFILSQIYAA